MYDYISEINNSIKKNEFAVFCGAGISKNSGLPLANELKYNILKKLPISKNDVEEIMSSNLPFEAFIEILSENSNISKIINIFKEGEPNANHILIARLAKKGFLKTILTTNFDMLIEKALENEGLERQKDFEVYFNEKQFSEINFNKKRKIIRIFKIHGSVENENSIRTTLKAVANKNLSKKRANIIKHLFSTGRHKKILILGYSCSDEFDITPQIKNIQNNQKEIIFIDHSDIEDIEDIKIQDNKNPFKEFQGKRLKCDTSKFITIVFNSLEKTIKKSNFIKAITEWKINIDNWAKILENNQDINYFIAGFTFYNISNFERAKELYEKFLKTKKEMGDKTGELKSYANLGNIYGNLGNLKKSLLYHNISLKIAKKLKNKGGESRSYLNIGIIYNSLGNFNKAIEYIKKSLKIKKEIRDKAGESRCYLTFGTTHYHLGNFKEAIKYYKRSLMIRREIGDIIGESSCYTNLGISFDGLGNIPKAIKYIERSLKIKKDMGEKNGESTCYVNLGDTFCNSGSFQKAIEYYMKALTMKKEIGDREEELRAYRGLGNVFYSLENPKKAARYYYSSLKIAKKIEAKAEMAICFMHLGSNYFKLEKFGKGREYYSKAEKIFTQTGQMYNLKTIYDNLCQSYIKNGDNKNAERYRKKLEQLKSI